MLRSILIVVMGFGTLLLGCVNLLGAEPDPAQAVVRVVGLDEQGNPQRQGLGVVVGKDGRILTSASLLIPGGAGVVRTGQGAKYLIQEVLYRDNLQDLAMVKVGADRLPKVDVGVVKRVHPGEVVRVGLQQERGVILQEARVANIYPFSSRLTLVKLNPPLAETEPGAPLFDSRGDLVGMVHAFAGEKGAVGGLKVILARGRDFLPRAIWLNPGEKSPKPEKEGERATAHQEKVLNFPNSPPNDRRVGQVAGEEQVKGPDNQGTEAYAAFWQGVRASQDLKWQEAQEWFTVALAAPGELPEAFLGRGVARYHLENYEGAVQDCLQATRHLPNYALASLWLGKIWERLGNSTEARKAYQQAVNQAPDLKEAWFALGALAYREGRLDQAQNCLERAGDEVEEAAQRAFYLGAIARSQGRLEQAQKAFAEAIKRDASFFTAYLERGKTLLDLGRSQEAAQILAELTRRDPQLPLARYYLVLAHLAAWDTKGAWEQYIALQKLDPKMASRLAPFMDKGR